MTPVKIAKPATVNPRKPINEIATSFVKVINIEFTFSIEVLFKEKFKRQIISKDPIKANLHSTDSKSNKSFHYLYLKTFFNAESFSIFHYPLLLK